MKGRHAWARRSGSLCFGEVTVGGWVLNERKTCVGAPLRLIVFWRGDGGWVGRCYFRFSVIYVLPFTGTPGALV
jgi:hypothetical protein